MTTRPTWKACASSGPTRLLDVRAGRSPGVANDCSSSPEQVGLEVSYLVYQEIITAYQHPDRRTGKQLMQAVIDKLRDGLPDGLDELAQLGRTLWGNRAQILAFFDHGGASNGPVEAFNGRLEHLRGSALRFRNFTHYVLRRLLHSGHLTARINAL